MYIHTVLLLMVDPLDVHVGQWHQSCPWASICVNLQVNGTQLEKSKPCIIWLSVTMANTKMLLLAIAFRSTILIHSKYTK